MPLHRSKLAEILLVWIFLSAHNLKSANTFPQSLVFKLSDFLNAIPKDSSKAPVRMIHPAKL